MDQPAATGDPGPRTPVLVGVGQASERLGQPGYQRRSPVGPPWVCAPRRLTRYVRSAKPN